MKTVGPAHVQPRVGRTLRTRPQQPRFRKGIALCLSGGGYRAMLFHLGTLIRLNELKMLPEIKRISSVSGGSIVAGFVGVQWDKLHFDTDGKATNLYPVIVDPIKRFAHKSIIQKNFWLAKDLFLQALDGRHMIFGQDQKRQTNRSAARMVKILEEDLFGDLTLQNLTDKGPAVYLNATNMQTGNMWLFSKAYMGDSKIGYINEPDVKLSEAVAASAAFPIVLSPFVLDVTGKPWVGDHKQEPRELDPSELEQEEIPEYADYENMDEEETTPLSAERIDRVFLSDGGVYDNLGLDVCWKKFRKIIVSDGGGSLEQQYAPADDVAFQGIRVVHVIDAQVRAFRKRQIIDSIDIFNQGRPPRAGAYFSIRGEVDARAYGEWNSRNLPLKCDPKHISELAHIETGLEELDESSTNRLINWGYAKCDATVRLVDHYLECKQMPVLLPPGVADKPEFPMHGYSV